VSDFKNIQELEKRLWAAADQLRANTGLTSQEYSRPVLGLIFLRYAEYRYEQAKERLTEKQSSRRRKGKDDLKTAIQAEGAMYVPDDALFSNLLKLPEDEDLGKAINDTMKALEAENEAIKDALPKTYTRFDNDILASLLKNFANIRFDIGSDVFGRIYEYFLTEFARSEGQGGGEFFTPSPLVRLIAEIIEPYHGKVFDPACGSGGMFVQSAAFVEEHKKIASDELSCFGQEKTGDTVRLAKMNLAVHGCKAIFAKEIVITTISTNAPDSLILSWQIRHLMSMPSRKTGWKTTRRDFPSVCHVQTMGTISGYSFFMRH